VFGLAKNRFIGRGKLLHAYACLIAYLIRYLGMGCGGDTIRNVEKGIYAI